MVEPSKTWTHYAKRWKLDSFPLFVFVAAVAAFLLINYVFCPRFVFWKGLYLPEAWSNPEVNRAVDALRQLNDPFERIDNPTNDIIQWRLLFPLIGHYSRLPAVVYLAIPQVGCVATLAYLIILSFSKTGSRRFAFLAAVAMGTSSWFFVSSGWLAYFDSWYILGLLIAAFHPLRRWLMVACLLVPWIDERFILGLPLTIAVRAIYFKYSFSIRSKPLLADLTTLVATTIPWIAFRLYLIFVAQDTTRRILAYSRWTMEWTSLLVVLSVSLLRFATFAPKDCTCCISACCIGHYVGPESSICERSQSFGFDTASVGCPWVL
jgi:hypothetical protein